MGRTEVSTNGNGLVRVNADTGSGRSVFFEVDPETAEGVGRGMIEAAKYARREREQMKKARR